MDNYDGAAAERRLEVRNAQDSKRRPNTNPKKPGLNAGTCAYEALETHIQTADGLPAASQPAATGLGGPH